MTKTSTGKRTPNLCLPTICVLLGVLAVVISPALETPQVTRPAGESNHVQAVYFAETLCSVFRWKGGNKMHSCEVDEFMSSINVTMELSKQTALQQCSLISDSVSDGTNAFRGLGWRLVVAYPGTNEPLATCGLK